MRTSVSSAEECASFWNVEIHHVYKEPSAHELFSDEWHADRQTHGKILGLSPRKWKQRKATKLWVYSNYCYFPGQVLHTELFRLHT
jgi:hypothetical protein